MPGELKYQIRVYLDDEFAKLARSGQGSPQTKPLMEIMKMHDATLKCQYDAFAGYVAEAQRQGIQGYPLYRWTKATIEDPVKKEKYLRVFAVSAGGEEVYSKEIADALELELTALAHAGFPLRITRHDTNPANNPQPPKRYSN
jgi:hypothetical protein